jgi:hypothetical protein
MWHSRPRLWLSRPPQIPCGTAALGCGCRCLLISLPAGGGWATSLAAGRWLGHISCNHAHSMRSVCARTSARRIAISRGKMKKLVRPVSVGPATRCRRNQSRRTRPSARFARANGTGGGKGRKALFPRAERAQRARRCLTTEEENSACEPRVPKGCLRHFRHGKMEAGCRGSRSVPRGRKAKRAVRNHARRKLAPENALLRTSECITAGIRYGYAKPNPCVSARGRKNRCESARIRKHSQGLARSRKNRCELVRFGARPQRAATCGAEWRAAAARGQSPAGQVGPGRES